MENKMLNLKETLSKKEKAKLVNETKRLLEYQNHVDSKKELKTLPSLSIKDIPSSINYLSSKKSSINGYKTIIHNVNSNKIAYLRMYFDLSTVAFDDLPYVYLLKNLLLNVKTKNYSVIELNKKINTYLGDLSFSEVLSSKTSDEFYTYFKVSASSLIENVSYIFKFIK